MTVLFMLLTVVVFLIIDFVVNRIRQSATVPAAVAAGRALLPAEFSLARNHVWVNAGNDGVAVLGIDEFLAPLLQGAQEIIFPAIGSTADPEGIPITIRNKNRALDVQLPLKGRIVEVNSAIKTETLHRDPYAGGWLVKIAPATKQSATLLKGDRAARFLKEHAMAAREFFLSMTGDTAVVSMQDGGSLVEGLLGQFDARVWKEFEKRFVNDVSAKNR
jgi:glycine cleavage system H protein